MYKFFGRPSIAHARWERHAIWSALRKLARVSKMFAEATRVGIESSNWTNEERNYRENFSCTYRCCYDSLGPQAKAIQKHLASEKPSLPPPPFAPCTCTVSVKSAEKLRSADSNGLSDPFVIMGTFDSADRFNAMKHTAVVKKTLNPTWNESHVLKLDEKVTPLFSSSSFISYP